MRALAILSLLAAAGCDSPSFDDGHLRCAAVEPRCPSGMHCATDGTCFTNGHDPDLGLAHDLAPVSDMGAPDAAPLDFQFVPIDLATVDECTSPVCECGTVTTSCGLQVSCGGDCSDRGKICHAGGTPNICGCPGPGRVGVYRKVSSDGLKTCLTAYPDNDCLTFTLQSPTPKFYAYEGDPETGTVTLIQCSDGAAFSLALNDPTCNGTTVTGVLGYIAPFAACGAVALHRYDRGANGWFYTTDLTEAPAGVTETTPPYYVWPTP